MESDLTWRTRWTKQGHRVHARPRSGAYGLPEIWPRIGCDCRSNPMSTKLRCTAAVDERHGPDPQPVRPLDHRFRVANGRSRGGPLRSAVRVLLSNGRTPTRNEPPGSLSSVSGGVTSSRDLACGGRSTIKGVTSQPRQFGEASAVRLAPQGHLPPDASIDRDYPKLTTTSTLAFLIVNSSSLWTLGLCTWLGVGNDARLHTVLDLRATLPFPEGLTAKSPGD